MALTKTRIIAGLLGANSLIAPDSDFVNTSYDKGVHHPIYGMEPMKSMNHSDH